MTASGRAADFWLFLGDNAYMYGRDHEYSEKVFYMYREHLKHIPLYTVLGNHDSASRVVNGVEMGPYFSRFSNPKRGEVGGYPSGAGAYYSFEHGSVHFVCLDSSLHSRVEDGPMVTWLHHDLANLSPTTQWLIAVWHHAPYSKGTLNSDSDGGMLSMRIRVLPILEAAGVDLVVGGHSHDYERSKLLNGYYGKIAAFLEEKHVVKQGAGTATDPYRKPAGITPHAGTVCVVAGSAGQADAKRGLNHPANVPLGEANGLNVPGTLVVDVDGGRLVGRFVDRKGTALDEFHIIKSASAQ
jgi:hypothetical protein